MPLYEYECRECDHRFDLLVPMSAADAAACPRCAAANARRLVSVIGGTTGTASAPAPVCGGGACASCS